MTFVSRVGSVAVLMCALVASANATAAASATVDWGRRVIVAIAGIRMTFGFAASGRIRTLFRR